MKNDLFNVLLIKIDPSKNMKRFYSMEIQPNLFGSHSVVRTWGRIGGLGQMKTNILDDETAAIKLATNLLRSKRSEVIKCQILKLSSRLANNISS